MVRRWSLRSVLLAVFASAFVAHSARAAEALSLNKGDKIVLLGGTLAERMLYFGHFETLLHGRFPQHELVVRNLGWSADAIDVRLRSQDFPDHGHTLKDHQPDVILAFFGYSESFAGPEGVAQFKQDLAEFIGGLRKLEYPSTTYQRGSEKPQQQDGKGEAMTTPRLVLFSPIACEDLRDRGLLIGEKNNDNLRLYTKAMAQVAAEENVAFIDLFTPSLALMKKADQPLTFNGVHLTGEGYRQLAPVIDAALFGPRGAAATGTPDLAALRAEVNEKNLQHFYDYRAINGFYIYGGRKKPFGVVNFPAEFAKLRAMINVRDRRIWAVAQGKSVPDEIDDSRTGEFVEVETNIKQPVTLTSPSDAIKTFTLPDGYEINLFASEVEFPDLENPVQFQFDARGRLWVCTMASYPMYLPGRQVNDKIFILEDTDGDGRADKQTTFAEGLHVPTGFELGDGGAYVAQQPNIVFLKDTDGDEKADERRIILHGFDSADSHHAISAFTWGPGGALYFQEGTFHHSQVESPYGPVRLANAGIFRYEPRTEKLDVFVSYPFANPWGHRFDRWGQNLVADASPGLNYFGTAFSGQVDHPHKHAAMQPFLVKQWRPTCGCELVSSRNFPDETQGDYLLNNCIGFQGVLRYRMKDDGSGFAASPVEPLLRSSDLNFRPTDLQFGPDGALYVIDWFNPLIGHMQHSLRDPNRDKSHGRIWRIRYQDRPLVEPPQLAGRPIAELLDALKQYEDRTRYRARRELREHETGKVMAELEKWLAGLDEKDENYEHHRLEALWVCQHHDVVSEKLLRQLLASPDYRVRAAATRVLCYWRDRVPEVLDLLKKQATDEHPRVRLEAVRAASFFTGEQVAAAEEAVLESLLLEQDYYLKYMTDATLKTLERRTR